MKTKPNPKGVYLTTEERDTLEGIVEELGDGWNVHRLIKLAISRFIEDYDYGEIKIKRVYKKITVTELK